MDRYIGVLSREVGSGGAQDNIDPITELLTQLSGWCWEFCSFLIPAVCAHSQVPTVGVVGGTVEEEGVAGDSSASFPLTSNSCWISRIGKLLSGAPPSDGQCTAKSLPGVG